MHRFHTTELQTMMHADEFIVVIDSLGRRWNPLLHPRDSKGRFIRTFSFVTFDLPGGGTASGRVSGIDKDGNLLVKVQGVTPGADPRRHRRQLRQGPPRQGRRSAPSRPSSPARARPVG